MSTETGTVRLVPAPWRGLAWQRAAATFVLTLLALFAFAAAFAAGYASFHSGRVLPGVSLNGIALGGLEPAAAETKLRRELPSLSTGELTIRFGETVDSISFAEIGRDYDYDAMLSQAMAVGRSGTPTDQVAAQMRTLMNGVELAPAATWNADELARRLATLVNAQQVAAVDARIVRPAGAFEVLPATSGQAIELEETVSAAMNALNNTSPRSVAIDVDPRVLLPAVTTEQAEAAAERGNAVTSEPLTVTAGSQTVTIDAATLSGWVTLDETSPGEWQVLIDEAAIAQWVELLKFQVDVPATNAGYTFEGRQAVATAHAAGSAVDADAAEASILGALQTRADGTPTPELALAMVTLEPEFTLAQAQELVTQVRRLGRWTTHYTSSASNGFGQNIRRPTKLINGWVVQPGEEFNFVEVAGPITAANGYTGGAAIIHGNTIFDGVLGGGLCSCSTTLFNAALRAGFDITERRNHAYFIDRYPVGLDATIWINGSYEQSMNFINDSPYPILIRGVNGTGSVTFQIFGVPDGRKVQILPAKVTEVRKAWTRYEYTNELPEGRRQRLEFPFDGFKSSVRRIVTDANGNVIHDDTFRSSYRRVIGHVLVGRGPDDPPAGTIEEPGKPPDA